MEEGDREVRLEDRAEKVADSDKPPEGRAELEEEEEGEARAEDEGSSEVEGEPLAEWVTLAEGLSVA